MLHTQADLKYRLLDKEKRNIHAYRLKVQNLQIPV